MVGFGSSLVHAEARFDRLVEYLLGRFVVVDHIDHAIALAKKYKHSLRIVTKEGELLNPGGSMSGGAYKNNNNLLGRHREMENLEKEVQAQRDRMRGIVKEQEEGRQEAKELQDAMENNRKIRQELILKQNTAKINYDRAKGDFLKNQDDLDQIRLESQGIDTQKAELTGQLDALKASISDTESKSKENETHLEELNKSLEQLREEEKRLTEKNSEYSLKISTEIQSNEFVAQNIERIDQTMKGLKEEFEATAGDSRQAENLMQTKQQEIESARKQIEETKKSIEALEETIRQELLSRGQTPERAAYAARLSEGVLGRAIALCGQDPYYRCRDEAVALLRALREKADIPKASLAWEERRKPEDSLPFLEAMEAVLRDIVRVQSGLAPFDAQIESELEEFARHFTIEGVACIMEEVVTVRKRVHAHVQWRSAAEPLLRRIVEGAEK